MVEGGGGVEGEGWEHSYCLIMALMHVCVCLYIFVG